MDELKPCPFCGGRAVIDVDRDEKCFLAHVFCTNYEVKDGHCHCEMKYWAESAEKAECDAVNAWNNRADDERYIEALDRVAGKWALEALNRADARWVHADAENRELRELVADMHKTIGGMKLKAALEDWLLCTDSCPHWANGDCVDLPDEECFYTVKMDELGIGTDMVMMPEYTTDEFKAKARKLMEDMHGLLQRICERRDECGRECEFWPDHSKQCDLRDIEERMAVLGIEVRE